MTIFILFYFIDIKEKVEELIACKIISLRTSHVQFAKIMSHLTEKNTILGLKSWCNKEV